MTLLVAVYTVNMIDRQILAILAEPIRNEFALSDSELGFLTGIAFVFFYAIAGLPIAHLADRVSRRVILSVSLASWSAMTAVSGFTQTFGQLAMARIGVGIGEAGCGPPSHAMIADLYRPEQRGRAIGIYGLGIPLGTLFGLAAGGWIATSFGWRIAFLVVGLPGMLLAVLVWITLPEPERGAAEGRDSSGEAPGLAAALRYLIDCRTFLHLAAGGTLITGVGGAMIVWAAPFLLRSHGLSLPEAGLALGLIAGVPGAAGMYFGGALADRLGRRDVRWRLWIVASALAISCPFAIATWLVPGRNTSLFLMIIPFTLCTFFYQATTFAQVQNISPLRMRASAAALLLLIMNLIGQGFGPQLVGAMSDLLRPAYGEHSLRFSLAIFATTSLWAAWHYWRAGYSLATDMASAAHFENAIHGAN
ncbi:MAG: MFS transporter [Beijerinckiaceae bacterium]|nr:MFS transporter [Beijerinckiaceae bacterium]